MVVLGEIVSIARKQWVKRKWDTYNMTACKQMIDEGVLLYTDPTHEKFKDKPSVSRWKATIDKKVSYLLARKPICSGHQDMIDNLVPFIRKTAKEYLLRGSLIWLVQPKEGATEPIPTIMYDTMAVYSDDSKEEVIAYIRQRVDIELEDQTGREVETKYLECYYEYGDQLRRDTWCYSNSLKDKEEVIEGIRFIELGKTGDAPLYGYIKWLLEAYDHLLCHQNETTVHNTQPLTEVRGYSGTSDEDLKYALEELSIARTDGNGGVTIHTRTMDSTSIEMWAKRVLQEWSEATCIVQKENELAYAQSGRAMDRLFIDAENSAKDLAEVLEKAIQAYSIYIGEGEIDIVWNTDKPTNDSEIISSLITSKGIVSDRTLLEQHPWVDDVEEEIRRIEKENLSEIDDLVGGDSEY